ncbi:MAG: NUDIX domain-containing protein [Candidatus Andersenbacteria bacterium]
MPDPTPQEMATCVAVLKQLEPGFLPLELFDQIARLVRLPMVDVVPISYKEEHLHIGLIQREVNDIWWPGMWHLPGTVLRSTDTMESAIQRLCDDELQIHASDPPVSRGFLLHYSKRGAEVVLIYTVENCSFEDKSTIKWFPINELPQELVDSERDVIARIEESLE